MPRPLEICLEALDTTEPEARFVRCVALPGAEPGLALDRSGAVQWMPAVTDVHGLRVSADGRLLLVGAATGGEVVVERGRRSLRAPAGERVLLRDQDLLRVNGRRLRVHVHGEAAEVHAPERLTGSALARIARAAAAALALGGALAPGAAAAGRADAPIEVRVRPPDVAPPRPPVVCTITAQKPVRRGGPIQVEATCPSVDSLSVGRVGWLLDPRTGAALSDGMVKITALSGTKITAEASQLKSPSRATRVRFIVEH
jgi:hypothetical protein